MAITTGILRAGTNSHQTTSEEANGISTDFVGQGIVGSVGNTSGVAPTTGGFSVNAQGTPDMTVAVGSGVAYVTGTPSSQNSQTFRVKNSASANTTISANASGSTKYDWLYIQLSAANLQNPNTAADNVATMVTSRSSSSSSDDGTPPTYGYAIAVITVANGATSITNGNIRDVRAQVILSTGASNPAGGWTTTSVPTTITALGNRSYTVLFPSVDLTSTVSNGMRLKLTRTVTAPTQCTDLESGSSQYYSKTTPAGMTFTDDFTVSAWVKLESYPTQGTICGRYNGTSGWQFGIESAGRVFLQGFNAGAANNSVVQSYQSIPLNKWVHVSAQLDMSAFTATTTTSYIMVDGTDVPATVTRGGTNPTALIQAGDLQIGAANTTNYFDGKIAQVAIYNAKVTQATIRGSISQTLSGSETSLISAYSFNNTINDLNANANNLTANGSALATNADSPFAGGATGTTEYAIITANTFSTNTTLTVQVPEGYAIPTTGGVSAVSYSTHKAPYGLPVDSGKWRLSSLWRTSAATTSNATVGSFQSGGWALVKPVGAWEVGYQADLYNSSTTAVAFALSPSSSIVGVATGAINNFTYLHITVQSPAAATMQQYTRVSGSDSISTLQTFIMYTLGSTTLAGVAGDSALCEIFAEFNLV